MAHAPRHEDAVETPVPKHEVVEAPKTVEPERVVTVGEEQLARSNANEAARQAAATPPPPEPPPPPPPAEPERHGRR